VPSFTFAASANAVRLVGADVVFADIDPDTFCLDPAAAEAAITPRTAALMPVHLYGHPAAMDQIMALAAKHSLAVVEDACQAHGASLNGTQVGAFGNAGTFSFYPTKNMHSLEGGMITVGDAELARTLRLLRNQGMEARYANEIVGANLRMTDVSAAVGRVQRAKLDGWTERRIANAAYLTEHITAPNVVTPKAAEGARHVYHQYTVRVRGDRDAASARLAEAGVGNAVYYPTPVHRLKPYWEPDQKAGRSWDLPETERAAAEVLSLPVHPALTQGDLDLIVTAVNELNELGESR
jgi:perosamine synthetase